MTGWDDREARPEKAGLPRQADADATDPALPRIPPDPATRSGPGPGWYVPGVVPAPGFPPPAGFDGAGGAPAGIGPITPPAGPGGDGAGSWPPLPGHPGVPAGAGPRPVRGLGVALQVLMIVGFVAGVVELVAAWGIARLIDRLIDAPGAVTEAQADRADQFQQTTATVSLVCFLATAVVFLIWFHRLRVNAGWWAPHLQRRGPGWAIGGWFVPVVNLWFPFTTAKDILAGSRPTADRSGIGLLKLWWAAWIGNFVLGLAYRGLARDATTIDDYATVANVGVVLTVLDLVLTVLAVLLVRVLTGLQERRLAADGRPT